MSVRGILFTALFAFATATAVHAEDAKTDAKTETKTETKDSTPAPRARNVIKPYSMLKDLTPEQTDKLKEIHGKALAQKKDIEAKEKEESMAVLTDDQKKELTEASAKSTAEKKASTASKKKDAAATESK